MKTPVLAGLAGASVAIVAITAHAQDGPGSSASFEDAKRGVEEIVVTARRRDESLQDVPQTVNAVTSESIQKLNLLKFEDLQAVVPGLTLGSNNNPATGAAASMRGVSFEARTLTSSTVEFYLNDAPVEANTIFQSMFDVGQIEVLRGPQGTLRGRAAPSGAVTVTTRKPDLTEFGGYAMASGTDRSGYNAQGALNLPVISEVLAVRVAGLYDENEFDGVRSIHNSTAPKAESKAGRVSVAFQPTENVDANLSYQYLERDVRSYVPVAGGGSAGQTGGVVIVNGGARFPYPFNPTLAANYNGPALNPGDRRGLQDQPALLDQKFDLIDAAVDWHVAGQRLSYVGGYRKQDLDALGSADAGNVLPGVEVYQPTTSAYTQKSHELRLASEERVLGRFDYTMGVFYAESIADPTRSRQAASYLSGAFGSPLAAPSAALLNSRYVLETLIDVDSVITEKSAFASGTWHVTNATEFTVGGRYIINKIDEFFGLGLSSAFVALPPQAINPALTACPAGLTTTYAGTCDVPLAATTLAPITNNAEDKPFVYNVQLSHRFNDALMAYANVGSSWRRGVSVLGIFNADNDPLIDKLTHLGPEKSRSYELGLKSALLDNRARLNVAVFHQDFTGLIFKSPQPISYLANRGTGLVPTSFQFINSADAVVDGVDLDATFQMTPRWNLALAASYADGHVDDDVVPCNDAAVTLTATRRVALCISDSTVSDAPQWSASLQSEYSTPVLESLDGYIRGLYAYYPANDEQEFFQAGSYGLLNLYLGVRAQDNAWDVCVYAKNATDTNETLALDNSLGAFQDSALLGTGYFGQPGYLTTRFTPRREIGLQVRYAFGSR